MNYYAHIKEAEIARCRKETEDTSDKAQISQDVSEDASEDVTEWEHREYFDRSELACAGGSMKSNT